MTSCTEYDIVDVAVIGAGPAGLTAGMYTTRAGLKTVVFGDPYAGQLARANPVENFITWTGSPSGLEIIESMISHGEEYGTIFVDKQIKQIIKDENGHFQLIDDQGNSTCAFTVILTSGTKHKKLGITGEEEYYAKGVGYCTICDGPLYKDQKVAIVGFGNEMLQAALRMASVASELYVFGSKTKIGGDPELLKELENSENVTLIEGIRPQEVIGDDNGVTNFKYIHNKVEYDVDVQAVFIEVGLLPSSAIASGVGIELEGNFIKVDRSQATNVSGFYAAGDITGGIARQAIVSAGDGARAAISAMDYIKKQGISSTKIKSVQWGSRSGKEFKNEDNSKSVVSSNRNMLHEYVHADDGFVGQYNRYQVNEKTLEKVKEKLGNVKLITISAHWCPDCRRNVPRMAKISENFDNWNIFVEDRDKEGVGEKYNVRKIPTFIFHNESGEEIARIIENPKYTSLEEDLLKIAEGTY